MSNLITTKSPIFWLIVCAGVVLPMMTLSNPARAIITSAVVALVVVAFVRARRQERNTVRRTR